MRLLWLFSNWGLNKRRKRPSASKYCCDGCHDYHLYYYCCHISNKTNWEHSDSAEKKKEKKWMNNVRKSNKWMKRLQRDKQSFHMSAPHKTTDALVQYNIYSPLRSTLVALPLKQKGYSHFRLSNHILNDLTIFPPLTADISSWSPRAAPCDWRYWYNTDLHYKLERQSIDPLRLPS